MSHHGCSKEKSASPGRCHRHFDGPVSGFGESCRRMGPGPHRGRPSSEHAPPAYRSFGHHGHHNSRGKRGSNFFQHDHNHHGHHQSDHEVSSFRPNFGHGHGPYGHGHGHHPFGNGPRAHHGHHGPHHEMTGGHHSHHGHHFGPHGHHHFGKHHEETEQCRFTNQRRHSADAADIGRHHCKH